MAAEQADVRQSSFFVFLCVGGVSALLDIAVLQGLVVLGVNVTLAATAGFVVGLLANYFGHIKFTFRKRKSIKNMAGYLLVVFMNYLLTLLCVWLSFHMLDNVLVGKLISLPLVAVNGFLLGKYWVFK